MAEWVRTSRLKGVLRYHEKIIGKLVVWVLLIMLAVQILSLLMPVITSDSYVFDDIRANFEIVFFAAFITGVITAGRSSRFLLRFGTARTSVWLGNMIGLLLGMAGLLLATFVLNLLVGALLLLLASIAPDNYTMTAARFSFQLNQGLQNLPNLLLYSLEWTAIFYFYACMLRRFRALTISVSVGVPLLFVLLMLIPAVRDTLSVLEENNQGQMVLLGLHWLQIIQDIVNFVQKHWDSIQLTAGIVCLPLSYLVMRGTKQP